MLLTIFTVRSYSAKFPIYRYSTTNDEDIRKWAIGREDTDVKYNTKYLRLDDYMNNLYKVGNRKTLIEADRRFRMANEEDRVGDSRI